MKIQVQSTNLKRTPRHEIPMMRAGLSDGSLVFGYSLELWTLNFEL